MNSLIIRRTLVSFAVIIIAATLFTACKKDNVGDQTPVAGLMAFNLSTDKSIVGITLSGNELVSAPLDYTNYTGGYLNIFPGDRAIVSYNNVKDSTLSTSNFNFESDKYYSLFVVGNKGAYQNVVAHDNFDSLSSTTGQAYVRYINAIPDSSAPVVTITANGTSVSNNAAPYASVSEFLPVTAGDIQIGLAGGDVISTNRTITIENGKAYTILLVGDPKATDTTRSVQIKFIKNAG